MLSSHVKRSQLLWLRGFHSESEMVWDFNIVDYIINRTLHGRLEICFAWETSLLVLKNISQREILNVRAAM